MESAITVQTLKIKRKELESTKTVKTSLQLFEDLYNTLKSQPDTSQEDIIEADMQLAKLYDYFGEMYKCLEILHRLQDVAKENKTKQNAKIRFLLILEYKRALEFSKCRNLALEFIKDYSSMEKIVWKYIYRTYTILAKLFQMLNSLEISNNYMNLALATINRHEPNKESKHHGIIYRMYGYQYWKFYKKSKADEYLKKAMAIFEKLKDPYLLSTIYKERGDMHKEKQEGEEAQQNYETCIRLRKQKFQGDHLNIEKIYFRVADNLMKERGNTQKLKMAQAYLDRTHENFLKMFEISSDDESSSVFVALFYQFYGKLQARFLDKEGCLKYYLKSEAIFLRANNGEYSNLMQSFFQFAIDDFSELGLADEATAFNKKYKQTLKKHFSKDDIFYIAYSIDIVAQEIMTKPIKTFNSIRRAQQIIEPILGRDSLIGLIFQLFEGLKDLMDKHSQQKGYRTIQYVEKKLLEFFEGDDRNPYFEAVYMAFYHFLHEQTQHETAEVQMHTLKKICHYLQKCLIVQQLQYGKYHSSVFTTLAALGDATFRLDMQKESLNYYKEAIEVAQRIGKVDKDFELEATLRIIKNDDPDKYLENIQKLDALYQEVDTSKRVKDKFNTLLQINNVKKELYFKKEKFEECIVILKQQVKLIGEENELILGAYLVNIYQDLMTMHYSLKQWDNAIFYGHKQTELVKKTVTQRGIPHEQMYNFAMSIIDASEAQKKLENSNAIKRFAIVYPKSAVVFAATALIGMGFIGFKFYKNSKA